MPRAGVGRRVAWHNMAWHDEVRQLGADVQKGTVSRLTSRTEMQNGWAAWLLADLDKLEGEAR